MDDLHYLTCLHILALSSKTLLGLSAPTNQQLPSNISVSLDQRTINTVPNTGMQSTQSPPTRASTSLHQPNNTPRGTYNLPEAGGTPFNPFKGHSLPNEPSGLIETRLSITSPPTKSDPSPSTAFSGAMHGAGRIATVQDTPQRLAVPIQSSLPSAPKVRFHGRCKFTLMKLN